jgi:DNA-binding response OmpR family regulator/DNA-binding CsgD family transcriptional regulator
MDKTARILIVESRPDLLRSLETLLHQAGYDTRGVGSDAAALQTMPSFWPDLILANLRTPDIDGLALARQIKEIGDVPIVLLAAIADRDGLLASLGAYVEDYITMPFDPDELVARITCILRRTGPGLQQPLVPLENGVILDFCQGRIYARHSVYELSATEARLLYHLARYAGQTVATDILLGMAWPQAPATAEQLHLTIRRLARRLGTEHLGGNPASGYSFTPSGRPDGPRLTKRQKEILNLIAQGLTNNEIALRLNISAKTVEFHYRQIRTSLNATSRPHAVAMAFSHGILPRVDTFQPSMAV